MEKLNSETNRKTQQEYYDEFLFEIRQIKDLLTILVGMEASDREDDGLEPLTYMDGTPRG